MRSLSEGLICATVFPSRVRTDRRLRLSMDSPGTELQGPVAPWGRWASLALGTLVLAGLWLRLRGLSAEGFGDDEVHKWLAANRYLHGVFSGDDVEHPMLMKSLITLTLLAGRALGWAPETITRLPNAVAGGVSVLVAAPPPPPPPS